MKLFSSRPFLAVMLGIGSVGIAGLLEITCRCLADHRGFPWALWLGGTQWFWCTWLAGQRLFRRRAAMGFHQGSALGKVNS